MKNDAEKVAEDHALKIEDTELTKEEIERSLDKHGDIR